MNKYLLIFLMLYCAPALGEVNKWVDSSGQVHYSDQPPPANTKNLAPTNTKKRRSSSDAEDSASKSDAAPAPKTIAEREADWKKAQKEKQEAADKAAQKQADAAARKEYCTQAQNSLNTLKSGARLTEVDSSGERSYIDDEQRQKRIAKLQQQIGKNCK